MSLQQTVEDAVRGLGLELVELERSAGGLLRVTIDRPWSPDAPAPAPITVDDCERVTRQLQYALEVQDVEYRRLEVSSPGIDRPLRRRQDFEKFCGSKIKLKTLAPIDGRGNYKGTLERLEGDEIVMEVDGRHYRIPFDALAKARLEVEEIPPKAGSN